MISPAYVVAFIGALVGLAIGMIVYGQITPELDCPDKQWLGTKTADGSTETLTQTAKPVKSGFTYEVLKNGHEECERSISTGWTILGIFPVMFWFGFLGMFNRFAGGAQQ